MEFHDNYAKCYLASYESYTKVWMSVYADMYLTPGPPDKMVFAQTKADNALSDRLLEAQDRFWKEVPQVAEEADFAAYHQARSDMQAYDRQAHKISVLMVKFQSQFLPRHAGTTVVQQPI
jgi:hypothetical protein